MFDGFTWKTTPYVEFRTTDGFNYSSQMFLLGAELAEYEDLFAQPGETIRGVTTRVRYWRISLLWLAIPLTLVSAGLILPRSRPKQAAIRNE